VDFAPWQYLFGAAAALLIGFSKTGVPGAGILMVPVMAHVFGGRLSVGATLPMLIFADLFAVRYYHQHARMDQLKTLAPWVVAGLLAGTAFLKFLGDTPAESDLLGPIIGAIVLVMLGISLVRKRMGDGLTPTSQAGVVSTGALAGFTTMVSNAAGPVMAIYLTSLRLPKYQLMGTNAWYFLIFNVSKVPLLVWLTLDNPARPLLTADTLLFNVVMGPMIVLGALGGRRVLPLIPQKAFENAVLVLAAVAAVKLLLT
jgi:uncharacterized protein